jgi:5-methylcytosine-specific restriction endonuclease McrA
MFSLMTTSKMAGRKAGQGSKWCRPSTRMAIYHRDGFCCAYCGASAEDGVMLTLDHVLACELGGDNSPSNLVTACLSCNSAKQDKTTREWFAHLRDQGVDTTAVGARVRRLTKRSLNRDEGRRLVADRQAARAGR